MFWSFQTIRYINYLLYNSNVVHDQMYLLTSCWSGDGKEVDIFVINKVSLKLYWYQKRKNIKKSDHINVYSICFRVDFDGTFLYTPFNLFYKRKFILMFI